MGFMTAIFVIEMPVMSIIASAIDLLASVLNCIEGGIEMENSSFLNRFKNVVAWLGGGGSEPIKQQGF